MKIGEAVTFTDSTGVDHDAVITNVFDNGDEAKYPTPAVNVCYVSSDRSKEDNYGRQMERATSVVHRLSSTVHGNTWKRVGE
jgi:hypothetical protein